MTEAIDRFSGILGEARGIAERLPFTEGIGWDEGMHNFKRQMLAAELLNMKVELERQESARMRDPNKFPRHCQLYPCALSVLRRICSALF
jgi:hypothetical protein